MSLNGIPVEFIIFALTLLGVAVLHRHNLEIAVAGLIALVILKMALGEDLATHFLHEAELVLNLLGLLLGFAILARHFELSGVPDWLPRFLPGGWMGGFSLLLMVAVLSTFLDNIAGAIIGGVVAGHVFKHKVSIGYLAAIVAASNAGGAGSVLGDTTTTMMWVAGIPAHSVADAFLGGLVSVLFFGVIASIAQQRVHPLAKDPTASSAIDYGHLAVVGLMIAGTLVANVLLDFPAAGLWAALVFGHLIRKTPWREMLGAMKGSLFLISLVLAASLMPVQALPEPSAFSTFSLGLVSALFDNIPLTALALYQGGYDWGMLAYAVGFGGSMIWFGSSAGVAICNLYPKAKHTGLWLKEGWSIIVAYVLGFGAIYLTLGWHPDPFPVK
jgi:Na+/H+ antiporter NhaD/arsenite permease-like protein